MDQQRWSELIVARNIWDREHRAIANQAAMQKQMLGPNVGQAG